MWASEGSRRPAKHASAPSQVGDTTPRSPRSNSPTHLLPRCRRTLSFAGAARGRPTRLGRSARCAQARSQARWHRTRRGCDRGGARSSPSPLGRGSRTQTSRASLEQTCCRHAVATAATATAFSRSPGCTSTAAPRPPACCRGRRARHATTRSLQTPWHRRHATRPRGPMRCRARGGRTHDCLNKDMAIRLSHAHQGEACAAKEGLLLR